MYSADFFSTPVSLKNKPPTHLIDEYQGEPAVTALCHCTDCQKWTGGAYTSNVVVPRTAFKVTSGTPKTYDAVGNSGKINK
jgi:hypothetical protein